MKATRSIRPAAPHPITNAKWVAGVDGCPGGWIVVLRPIDDPSLASAKFCSCFAEVLELDAELISVDMPIGLPTIVAESGRHADKEARAKLGRLKSSVFAVPSRSSVMQLDYQMACMVAQQTSTPPRKISKQAFNIFPKIREIDALMTPALQSRVYETHPEVAFWALNGEQPLDHPKKHKEGLDLRRNLLSSIGYLPEFLTDTARFRPHKVGKDDLIDAAVCSWTAARIASGTAKRFPETPSFDARGLRMEIWG